MIKSISAFLVLLAVAHPPVGQADDYVFRSSAPAFLHPGMEIFFETQTYDDTDRFLNFQYELLSSPTNVSGFIGWNRGATLVMHWRVDAVLLGTTAEFIIRTTATEDASFAVTNVLRIPVVAPPLLQALRLSNGVPVLKVTNLPVALSYEIQAASSVVASNWTVVAATAYYSSSTEVMDSSATNYIARFYRLRPVPYACYSSSCP